MLVVYIYYENIQKFINQSTTDIRYHNEIDLNIFRMGHMLGSSDMVKQ